MAEVLAVPVELDSYYQSPSPRCSSPQHSYSPYESAVIRSHVDSYSLPSRKLSPPPSTASSSPALTSITYSPESSSSSLSISSSVSIETKPIPDDSLFFPVYDFGTVSLSPSPEPFQSPIEDSNTDCPRRHSISEAIDPDSSLLRRKAADDAFMRHEPSRHVDYLSHDWNEEDIWASWRYIVGNRKVHSNATRLENASWRTWAKKINRLRTVSAAKLNWMKDYDVTWLYGPLSIGAAKLSRLPPSPSASPADAKAQSYKTKPILKKRSVSEIMHQKSLSTSSLLKQATAVIESQQYSHYYPPSRPVMVAHASSDYSSLCRPSYLSPTYSSSDVTSTFSTGYHSPLTKRHIHFNNQVQQCIALETDDDDFVSRGTCDEDCSSNDEMLLMARSNTNNHHNIRRERGALSELQMIAYLPSTTLKNKDESVKRKANLLDSISPAPKPTPPPPLPANSLTGTTYMLEDDKDMADDWGPNCRFSNRQVGLDSTRLLFAHGNASQSNLNTDTFQLPNFNSWDDENPATAGLFGRAVNVVNTARDIAHVLWNVGWRR